MDLIHDNINTMTPSLSMPKIARFAAVTVILILCIWILSPFLNAFVWGSVIAVACEPMCKRLALKWGSTKWAATAIVSILALTLVLPIGFAVTSASLQLMAAFDVVKDWIHQPWPSAPAWITNLPWVGTLIENSWDKWSHLAAESGLALAKTHAGAVAAYAAIGAGSLGIILIHALLSLLVTGVCLAYHTRLTSEIHWGVTKVFGPQASHWVHLSSSAIRGVSLGVCGTALFLTVITAFSLWVVDIPMVSLLACLAMFLCLTQIGPLPILVPVTLYLVSAERYGAAIFVGGIALFLSIIDGILRPYLIGREIKMPMALIFIGVVGGLITFGMLGLFIGPLALAMGEQLWEIWRHSGQLTVEEPAVSVVASPLPSSDPSEVSSKNP